MQRLGLPQRIDVSNPGNTKNWRETAHGANKFAGNVVVGCHVRRGDKVGGGRAGRFVVEMDVYKKELAGVVQRTRPNVVLLAGDDLETLVEMSAFCKAMVCMCACVCVCVCVCWCRLYVFLCVVMCVYIYIGVDCACVYV